MGVPSKHFCEASKTASALIPDHGDEANMRLCVACGGVGIIRDAIYPRFVVTLTVPAEEPEPTPLRYVERLCYRCKGRGVEHNGERNE